MMMRTRLTLVLGALLLAGCASADEETPEEGGAAPVVEGGQPVAAAAACAPQGDRMDLAGRVSPYDSTTVALGDAQGKVCYGRPSRLGRTIFGDLIPFGEIWRTGANEPTTVHLPVAASIAGIAVEPGSYSLYTVPGETEWQVVVNRSTSQWGIESQYAGVEAQEVGRAAVPAERTESPVEQFTIGSAPTATGAELLLEWENTRVRIPVNRS
jgi:Protein of unknown function (DUF2911)